MPTSKAAETLTPDTSETSKIWSHTTANSGVEFNFWGTTTPFVFELEVQHPDLLRMAGKRIKLDGREEIFPAKFAVTEDVYNDLNKALRKYTQKLIYKTDNDYNALTKSDVEACIEEISKRVFGVK